MRTVITGGAGFIGSHLCEHFLAKGHDVLCLDNLLTGSRDNIAHLESNPKFKFVLHDVTTFIDVPGPVDNILHFASPASPADFERLPIQILKVGALGTHNALGLAKAKKAKFLLASTSEVYGDPEVNPQPESYLGRVNCVGIRGVYDESKRFAEAITMAYHRIHKVETRIVRIFNSVLADQTVVVFEDGKMHVEPIGDYAERLRVAPDLPRRVFVPAFDPTTLEMTLAEASALIRHPVQNDAFELRLRYGRTVKVTGDHSVFIKGPDDRPLARPVRDLVVGDYVAIPARLPVIERDRPFLDVAGELDALCGVDEAWSWAIQHDSLGQLVAERREEIHGFLQQSGRFSGSKRRRNTIVCRTKRWIAQGLLPLAVLRHLRVAPPEGARIGPCNGGGGSFLPSRIALTDDLLWLFGFFLAEGCAWSGKGSHYITFSSDQKYLDRAARMLVEHFQVATNAVPHTVERAPSVYAHSVVLHAIFTRLLRLRDRRIPAWVMQLPLSRVKHFLEGFRCGDGTHSGKLVGKELAFNTKHEALATDLTYLLMRFGLVSSVGQFETTFRRRYGDRKFPFWRVTICEVSDFDILTWDHGVEQTLNARRVGDLVWSLVNEIRPCVLTSQVYDFSVPGHENFVAGNGVSCHNTYGPRMQLDDGRALPNFATQALRNDPITVYGDGSQTRSFGYVSDLVDGIDKLLASDIWEPVNIGNPDEVTLLEVAREVIALTGSKSQLVFRPLPPGDPKVRRPDITRARDLLGWTPTVSRKAGFERTLADFKKRFEAGGGKARSR